MSSEALRSEIKETLKVTTMREVYWECPIGFRWAWKDTDIPLADRTDEHDVLFSLQKQMATTGERYTLLVNSDGIAMSVETLTHMTGLLDWATTFNGSQMFQQLILICSTSPWRDDNLLTATESFFQTNAYHSFTTCIRGHMGPVPASRTEAAPGQSWERDRSAQEHSPFLPP